MPNVIPTIPQEPAQGIQAQLDTVYLFNPDVANGIIEKCNEVIDSLGGVASIKPYEELEAPILQYQATTYDNGLYTANHALETLPAEFDPTQWTLIASTVEGLATVAKTGDYDDLINKPTIPVAQVNSDWAANSGVAEILNKPTLGTAAAEDTTAFATAAQGTKADTAVQPGDLATVATSGSYNDLDDKPTIPAAQVNSDWNADSGVAQILNKPTLGTMAAEAASDYTKTSGLATVATTGAYSDLSGTPTIPTVNDSTITITQGGVTKGSFTLNQSSAETIDIDAGGSALPSQTGNSGKFLTTDGTDASWATALTNNTTQTGSLGILAQNDLGTYAVAIGPLAKAGGNGVALGNNASTSVWSNSIAIGYNANSDTTPGTGNAIAIGSSAGCGGPYGISLGASAGVAKNTSYGIGIGYRAQTTADNAIQLGHNGSASTNTTNSDANTFKVANANGNFEIMSADGTVPSDRLTHAINKYSTMPTASASNEGWIVQFTGTTDSTYTHGYIYECKAQGTTPDETYAWEAVEVQASSGGGSLPSQAGNSGKFLTTDGTNASWGSALPLSGGTMSGKIKMGSNRVCFAPYSTSTSGGEYIWGGKASQLNWGSFASDSIIILGRGDSILDDRIGIDIVNRFIAPVTADSGSIGHEQRKWGNIYTNKINNGTDINVPTTGGTMVVATPPSAAGTYTLKATVDSGGNITTTWVLDV